MTEGPGETFASRLDGAERRAKTESLWRAWRQEGRGAALLFGFSGVGKSDGVIRPIQVWAARQGVPTVRVDVPADSVDLQARLQAAVHEELIAAGRVDLAAIVANDGSFVGGVRALLRAGTLVVIDEFQRAVDPDGRPSPVLAQALEKLAGRPADPGCLLLVSNRRVDWAWTDPFYVTELLPPEEDDAARIVLEQLDPARAGALFPPVRRAEVVRRLGRNPRVLRLLGLLLEYHVLDDLLPPEESTLEEPKDPILVENIERALLAKAAADLPPATRAFVRDISIIRDWADWGLIEAMGSDRGDVREMVQQATSRYLLQTVGAGAPGASGTRYLAHPLGREADRVNLRGDRAAWEAAHRRAARWYAHKLHAAGQTDVHDRTLLAQLDGVVHHLTAIDGHEDLLDDIAPMRRYIGQRYGMSGGPAGTAGERDARIRLLELYNSRWGTPGTHYYLARLLDERGGEQDLREARRHVEKAIQGQDEHAAWVLWVRLVHAVDGPEAGIAAARKSVEHVHPAKSLFALYQVLGSYLNQSHRTAEAIAALREGTERVIGNQAHLAKLAVQFAAGEPTDGPLEEIRDWLRGSTFEPVFILAEALLLERRQQWREAIARIGEGRTGFPSYVSFQLHESICHLALGDGRAAEDALAGLAHHHRRTTRTAVVWCAAFAALGLGDVAGAARLCATFHGGESAASTPEEVRAALLTAWDENVAVMGTPLPSLEFPVLPPALTGLPTVAIRPQYGGNVLPRHTASAGAEGAGPAGASRLHVLALATAWSSTSGGVNTVNRQLCISLAATARVTCVVLDAGDEERREAGAAGVTLLEAPRLPGASDSERLSYPPANLAGPPPDAVIGHGRWTGQAARRLALEYRDAKRLHFLHVIPEDIERHKEGSDADAAEVAEERQEIDLALSTDAGLTVAVGPRIYSYFHWDLERRGVAVDKLRRFDPGFDLGADPQRTPSQHRLIVLVVGRMEDARLKGLDIAARAFNEARKRTGEIRSELLIRGAPPGKSVALEAQAREWAADKSLPVRAHPYSTRVDRLEADLRGASLVLMPSRAEGFGLVAAEAIVAGTPVLVSRESGIGELLEVLEPEDAKRIVVPVTGDDDHDVAAWANAIAGALRDRKAEFERTAQLRARLAEQLTWSSAAADLLAQVRGPRTDGGPTAV
ncbi:glycosyltransferase [Actinoplanes sp. NPDC049118]|uniref:glycosyltransferase n=1 Tax=Actinoplanes sp. NPDC049118 TaxID=3155769 RepID=UPI0033D9395D